MVDHFSTILGEPNQWQDNIDLAVAAPVCICLNNCATTKAKGSNQEFRKMTLWRC